MAPIPPTLIDLKAPATEPPEPKLPPKAWSDAELLQFANENQSPDIKSLRGFANEGNGSWGQKLPTLSPGTATSPVSPVYNPFGLTGPALQEFTRQHQPNTIHGREAILNTDQGMAQAGIGFRREMALEDHRTQNTEKVHEIDWRGRNKQAEINQGYRDNRFNLGQTQRANQFTTAQQNKIFNSKAAADAKPKPVRFTPEEAAAHRAAGAAVTIDAKGDKAIYPAAKAAVDKVSGPHNFGTVNAKTGVKEDDWRERGADGQWHKVQMSEGTQASQAAPMLNYERKGNQVLLSR